MNIRLRFKLIALLIVLSLAGLLVFQGYWLKGLYDTLYKQMEINIEEAMKGCSCASDLSKKNRERWDLKPKMCTSAQS